MRAGRFQDTVRHSGPLRSVKCKWSRQGATPTFPEKEEEKEERGGGERGGWGEERREGGMGRGLTATRMQLAFLTFSLPLSLSLSQFPSMFSISLFPPSLALSLFVTLYFPPSISVTLSFFLNLSSSTVLSTDSPLFLLFTHFFLS